MPIFTWDPVPTFIARQINTLEDGDLWAAEAAAAGALEEAGEGTGVFSSFVFTPVEGDEEFWVEYTSYTDVDGQVQVRVKGTYGQWLIANGAYNSNPPWFESEPGFGIRFQPFNGLA